MPTTRREFISRALARVTAAAAQEAEELGDDDIAAFVESVELLAADAHDAAARSGKLGSGATQALGAFAAHHREHASTVAGHAGGKAKGRPHPRLADIVTGQLQGAADEAAMLGVLQDVENALAATHLYAIGAAKDGALLRTAASLLPVESQHAVVVGQLLGRGVDQIVPELENQDRALDPTKFPLNPTTTTAAEA